MKVICIVSSGQPSANPRVVKEAISLSRAGYRIKVIYCPLSAWADPFDRVLFEAHPEIKWEQAGYHRDRQRAGYLFARMRKRFYSEVYKLSGNRFNAAILSSSLFSRELEKKAKKHRADLYIGHNLGALPAVVKAAKKYGTKCSFDFEDFHRGETGKNSLQWEKNAETEGMYIPSLNFASTASPMITGAYQFLFPKIDLFTVNNCFPLKYAAKTLISLEQEPMKLFWFSQNVGKGRGLENIIEAMGLTGNGNISLTLLGNCTESIQDYFSDIALHAGLGREQLLFHGVVEEKEIVRIAAQHHIGIASEVPLTVNHNICLANKIFMYLPAGNAILFSDTKAHSFFLKENPGTGMLYRYNDIADTAAVLRLYLQNPLLLAEHRKTAFNLGQTKFNWDIESQILLDKIREVIGN